LVNFSFHYDCLHALVIIDLAYDNMVAIKYL